VDEGRGALRGGRALAARFCSGAVTVTGGRLCRSLCASALNGMTDRATDASSVLRARHAGDARQNMDGPDAGSLAGFLDDTNWHGRGPHRLTEVK
jgi:hypothetical protein